MSKQSYIFDINIISSYLEKYKKKLSTLYFWNAKIDKLLDLNILTKENIAELNLLSPFEKGLKLKSLLSKSLENLRKENQSNFQKLCLWIVKDWGGIKTSKDKDTITAINQFLNTDKPSFKRIASTSKVGSFLYPDKNIIYDSRVSYALNWIILSEKAGKWFFPLPEGRNSKMSAFDIKVLIRLSNINNYKVNSFKELTKKTFIRDKDRLSFIPEQEAYFELIKLIKAVHKTLWNGEKSNQLYYTEMLLFSIADNEIVNDILSKVTLNLGTSF